MLPTLLQIGPISISSYGTCLAIGLLFFAFLVWYSARDRGVEDEKILDNVIVVVTLAAIGARIFFVLTHWSIFSPNLLRIFLAWKFPGLSFWGALLTALAGFYFFSRKQKLDRGLLFDCYGTAIPVAVIFTSLAAFLDGTIIGKVTTSLPWGMPSVGEAGLRHPVALYALVLGLVFAVSIIFLRRTQKRKSIARSFVGWVSLLELGLTQFVLALVREDLLYLGPVAVQYALSMILIIWPLGPLFILLNGPVLTRQIVAQIQKSQKAKKT